MSQIAKVFQFQYQGPPATHVTVPVIGTWVPARPIADALGINWRVTYNRLQETPHKLIKLTEYGGRQVLCLQAEQIQQWFESIQRTKNRDRLNFFLRFFVPALQSFLSEQPKEAAERAKYDSVWEPELLTQEQALKNLAEYKQVSRIDDTQLTLEDHVRILLNRRGLFDWDFIDYIVRIRGVVACCRTTPEDDPEPYEMKEFQFSTVYYNYKAVFETGEWEIAPLFFLRYPWLHRSEIEHFVYMDHDLKRPAIGTRGRAAAPWFEEPFRARILKLYHQVLAREEDEMRRRVFIEHFGSEARKPKNETRTNHSKLAA